MESEKLHQIIVVGGGAGGLELATKLGRKLGKKAKAHITLVDAARTHIWKPLLHEVAAGSLNSYYDEMSYFSLAHHNYFDYRLGRVDQVDRKKKEISIAPSTDENGDEYIPRRHFRYDTLILAVGSQTNDFGISGIADHCFFLDTRYQADIFHQHMIRTVYKAETSEQDIPGQLNIAIAGAGATGVELSAELHNAFNLVVKLGLKRLKPEDIHISIIEAADRILPVLPERLSEKATESLKGIDIDVRTGERITEANEKGFITDKSGLIPAYTKVWAAGIKAPEFLSKIEGLESNRINQLSVRPSLQVTNDDDIFAIGDCAACPLGDDSGRNVPPRAQAAHQQADLLVKTMIQKVQQPELKAMPVYNYTDHGSLVSISLYSTVGNLMGNLFGGKGFMIEGSIARLVYLSLYKTHQLSVLGFVRTAVLSIAGMITERFKPRLKFH